MDNKLFIVRNCELRDLPRVIKLLKLTNLFWESGDREEVFAEKIRHEPDSVMVLVDGTKIIGVVTTIYDPWASFIWHLAIDPEYQGQGLGHLLADEAERRLRLRGTAAVNGYIISNNRNSLSFFKKRGYDLFEGIVAVEKPL